MKQVTIFVAALALAVPAMAAGNTDEDWPCVQRKIPELSAGMMWAGPAIDEAAIARWQDDQMVGKTAQRLAARRTTIEEAQKLIEEFAAAQSAEARQPQLTALFAGVLSLINNERKQIMTGIVKYTRKQKQLVEEINQTRQDFAAALENKDKSEEAKKLRRDLEQKLIWQSRIHEEREKSLQFVCESPVILEQRAFELAREIANHLE